MVNIPTLVPGQVPPLDHGRSRRLPSQPSTNSTVTRSNSLIVKRTRRDYGLNNRLAAPTSGSVSSTRRTLLKRPVGRLPWLDGNAHSRPMPGEYVNEPDEVETKIEETPQYQTAFASREAALDTKPSIYHADPQLRPYGSTQSLGRVVPRPNVRRPSSISTVKPPYLLPKSSGDSLGSTPHTNDRRFSTGKYSPSAYSGTAQSEKDSIPLQTLPRKDAASYERLVTKPFSHDNERPSPQGTPLLLPPVVPHRRSSLAPPRPIALHNDIEETKSTSLPYHNASPQALVQASDGNLSSDPPTRVSSVQTPRRSASDAMVQKANSSRYAGAQRQSSMEGAVSGLHDLMEEALQVAADAARENKTDEVAAVLNEATIALRRASTVGVRMMEPLQLSDLELGESSSDGDSSDISSDSSDGHIGHKASEETVPTISTGSVPRVQQPVITAPYSQKDGERPQSEEAIFDERRPGGFYPDSVLSISRFSPPPEARTVQSSTQHYQRSRLASDSGEVSIARTPSHLYSPPSADSIVIDFAYVERGSKDRSDEGIRPSIRLGPPTSLRSASARRSSVSSGAEINTADVVKVPSSQTTSGTNEVHPGQPVDIPSTPNVIIPVIVKTNPALTEAANDGPRKRSSHHSHHHHPFGESSYYKLPEKDGDKRPSREHR